jgi:hypothetical protein
MRVEEHGIGFGGGAFMTEHPDRVGEGGYRTLLGAVLAAGPGLAFPG